MLLTHSKRLGDHFEAGIYHVLFNIPNGGGVLADFFISRLSAISLTPRPTRRSSICKKRRFCQD